jgi:hypothetical protein
MPHKPLGRDPGHDVVDDVLVEKRVPLNILHRRFAVFSMIFMNVPGGSSPTTPCQGDYE